MLVLVDLLVYNCIAPMIPVHVPVNTDRYCCTRVLVPVLYLVLFTATGTAVPTAVLLLSHGRPVLQLYYTAVVPPTVAMLPVSGYTSSSRSYTVYYDRVYLVPT